MTWLVSWPTHSGPAYQTAAEQRAEEIVRQGKARTAVAWEINGTELSE